MHLTNYAINKDNENFVQNNSEDINSGEGSKRHLNWLRSYLSTNGHDDELLFQEIEQIIVKTMISVQPSLSHQYKSCQPHDIYNNMCFEILGFDIMLDHKLKP